METIIIIQFTVAALLFIAALVFIIRYMYYSVYIRERKPIGLGKETQVFIHRMKHEQDIKEGLK